MRSVLAWGRFPIGCAFFFIFIFSSSSWAAGQQAYVRPRISQPIDESRTISLKGSVHPLAPSQFDFAVAPPDFPWSACCWFSSAARSSKPRC